MDAYLSESLDRIKKDPDCQALLKSGKTFTGSGQGKTLSCQPTESGLVGAMHLGGNGKGTCGRILNQTGNPDSLGTSTTYYMCKHGGKALPGACTPAAYDTNVDQPVATQQQLDALQEAGVPTDVYTGGPSEPLRDWWVGGLMLMAEQFTANMEAQVMAIGKLFDAKHQLETQRLFQEKQARAHKDYQPSEQMCTFGTFTRDLVATERTADLTKTAVAQSLLQRELGTGEGQGKTEATDSLSRIGQFRTLFCDPTDNANGLALLCPKPGKPEQRNADINFTTTLDQPFSLKINLRDTETTTDEEAVFALIDNLFAHDPPERVPDKDLEKRNYQYHYLNMRSIAAMRGIARNSIANIIALKTATPGTGTETAAPYMRALMRDFGLKDDEIKKLLGDNPSYYAQMELLTKKIYQSPTFYTNLYDKPVNVDRIRAAMKAIKLMQDRDIQASLQRREMLLSMMLELRLRTKAAAVYNATERAMYDAP